ncbi:putative gelsolin repeat protein [Erysiphe neolycopersici]|uniref:Putative gelsolin repeat protein n=1 Tax=Erysiphe neolycopersici TaxID=212602 RepID=A0A420HR27_9PEZI|nr:putative gelsolin repeat protein [Erysiphe neolycopersici]
MSSTIDESEDVQDFLERIKEIGKRRNQEDEERNRKLEEDIIQSKKERQARRAERARSISPTKSSPMDIPIRYRFSVPQDLSTSDFPKLSATGGGGELQHGMGSDGDLTPIRRKFPYPGETESNITAQGTSDTVEKSSTSDIASNITPRSPTLLWQQRPSFKAPNTHRINQVPEIATENAIHCQAVPTFLSPGYGNNSLSSEDQISQILASSNSPNLKQPKDQEIRSISFENCKSVDNEDSKLSSNEINRTSDITDVESLSELERRHFFRDHLLSHSRNLSESELSKTYQTNSAMSKMSYSPVSSVVPQKFEQHDETKIDYQKTVTSPGQVYRSLERSHRSSSPTKGAGGFVQSAMMRRNDSVNKRWSACSSPNIVKPEVFKNTEISGTNSGSSPLTKGNLPKLDCRPHSSHGVVSNTQGRFAASTSVKSNTPTPLMKSSSEDSQGPTSQAENSLEINNESLNLNTLSREEKTPPSSPKTFERRRWSPTKSSWLEAALNKPDFNKPKPKTTLPLQQSAWKTEINKVKPTLQPDTGRSAITPPKHEVNIGGLMRSRPTGSSLPPGDFATLNSRSTTVVKKTFLSNSATVDRLDQSPATKSPANLTSYMSSTIGSRGKFEQSPKIDFRANLKPRNLPIGGVNSNDSELKNKFVKLRPTKTQNYVAPDELKENITRGKASLNITGGPQKTNHKDEFKEAILKKKEDFRKAKLDGKGISRASTEVERKPIPEALIKQKSLGRSNSIASVSCQGPHSPDSPNFNLNQHLTANLSVESVITTGQPQNKSYGNVSERFNPNLTGLLAQGPNKSSTERHKLMNNGVLPNSEEDSPSKEGTVSETQLIFLTKDRARGPRRKPPSRIPVTKLSLHVQSKHEDNSNKTLNSSDPSCDLLLS